MSTPNMNPLAAKLLGGKAFREQLQQNLLDRAARTDDPAFRQRLEEIAHGKRPLRTLLADPAFRKELQGMTAAAEAGGFDPDARGDLEEVRAQMKDRLAAHGTQLPSQEEAQAIFADVQALQAETESVIRAEELTGWGGTVERLRDEE